MLCRIIFQLNLSCQITDRCYRLACVSYRHYLLPLLMQAPTRCLWHLLKLLAGLYSGQWLNRTLNFPCSAHASVSFEVCIGQFSTNKVTGVPSTAGLSLRAWFKSARNWMKAALFEFCFWSAILHRSMATMQLQDVVLATCIA
jgi:hypothetical protein